MPLQTCCAGDWHRAVHVWIYAQSTHRLLIQKRAACKESWPNLWDISAAGHGALLHRQNWSDLLHAAETLLLNHIFCIAVTAGDQSLETAQRETQEELGVDVPVEVDYKHPLSLLLSHTELHASVCSLGTRSTALLFVNWTGHHDCCVLPGQSGKQHAVVIASAESLTFLVIKDKLHMIHWKAETLLQYCLSDIVLLLRQLSHCSACNQHSTPMMTPL